MARMRRARPILPAFDAGGPSPDPCRKADGVPRPLPSRVTGAGLKRAGLGAKGHAGALLAHPGLSALSGTDRYTCPLRP
jgi:hypothetical protein